MASPPPKSAMKVEARQLVARQLSTIGDALAEAVKRRNSDVRRRGNGLVVKTRAAAGGGVRLNSENGVEIGDKNGRSDTTGSAMGLGRGEEEVRLRTPGLTNGSAAGSNYDLEIGDDLEIGNEPETSRDLDSPTLVDGMDGVERQAGSEGTVTATPSILGLFGDLDPKQLMLELEHDERSFAAAAAAASMPEETDPRKLLAEFEMDESSFTSTAITMEDDPKQLMAELEQSLAAASSLAKERDLRKLLAEFDMDDLSFTATSFAMEDDPKKMLAQLDESSSFLPPFSSDMNDPKQLLAELERSFAPGGDKLSEGNEGSKGDCPNGTDAVSAIPIVVSMPSEAQLNGSSESHNGTSTRTQAQPVAEELVIYVLALRLEKAGYDWPTVFGWTKYLFSEGIDGHDAQQAKKAWTQKIETELKNLAEQTSLAESKHREVSNKTMLPYRIVVTNLSADAGEEELAQVFNKFGIRDIIFLKERHPTNRTQAAYIEFFNCLSAREASHVIERIFGLKIQVRLAVDVFGGV